MTAIDRSEQRVVLYREMRICTLGGYDPDYPRNTIIRKGLAANGVEVKEFRAEPRHKFWRRYPYLFFNYLLKGGQYDFIFLPEFCQKDVPLARFLSILTSGKTVFDPLAPRYETKILDRQIGSPDSFMARWNHAIDTWALKWSHLILADTEAHRAYYCREFGIAPDKTAVLPVGFDDEVFRPAAEAERTEGFTVLFFGSFLPLHGVEAIVKAAGILNALDPAVRFVLLGSGDTHPQARKLVEDLNVTNLGFEGWVPFHEIPAWIRKANICLGIFGQTEKTRRVIPHKIYQALAMKKPVVTASTPAVKEIFTHGRDIFLCDEPYPESLAQAVLRLKADERLRSGLAEAGFTLVRDKYTPMGIGQKLLDILRDRFGEIST